MKKLIIALAIITASFAASAKTEITADNQFSVISTSNQLIVSGGNAPGPMICNLIATKSMTDDYGNKFNSPYYRCSESVMITLKRYINRRGSDTMFVFDGDNVIYIGDLK